LRPAGCLVEGAGLDECTGQLGLDPGAQVRRGIVAQHRQRFPAEFFEPEVGGRITDPLDGDGRPGDDLGPGGSFAFGLDVIGPYLIEVNVTSVGALRKADALLGWTLCADLLASVLGPLEEEIRRSA